jgi:pimeloyl-ACP methyl ester carboxylesterase
MNTLNPVAANRPARESILITLCRVWSLRAGASGVLLALLLACSATEPSHHALDGASVTLARTGRHLHLNCQGSGSPTVLLEAGMAGWSTDWALVQGAVATHTRTCAYDRAGYGASDPPAPAGAPTPQNDLQDLLDSDPLAGPVVLVGHSMGGLLVADYARRHPERVAGLVLVDAVHRQQDVDDHPTVHSGEYARQRAALTRLADWAVWLAPTGVLRLSGTSASLVAPRLPEPARSQALATAWSRSAYAAIRAENAGFDAWLALARQAGPLPQVPAAVLSSTQPRDFPPGFDTPGMQSLWAWRQMQLAQELGVSAQAMANSGHYPHVDQAPQVVQAVLRVLQQARRGVVQEQAPQSSPS